MTYTTLGGSDLEISRVMLGTWALGGWLWGGTDRNDPVRAIQAAIDNGMTAIDTAPVYGFGLSEELVGKAIRGRRSEVVIATKFGLRWDVEEGSGMFETEFADGTPARVFRHCRKASIMEECENSLRRLGVAEIDLYQCHWPDTSSSYEDVMEACLKLQEQGKIRAIGVSNFDVDMMTACRAVAPLASLQPQYSLLARGIEDSILPFCRKHNIGVLCYSPMHRGVLTGKIKPGHAFGPGDNRAGMHWYKGEGLRQVNTVLAEVVQPVADAHSATLAQISVAWCLAQPGVTAAIVGARNEEQAVANAGAAAITLAPEEVTAITAAFDALLAAG